MVWFVFFWVSVILLVNVSFLVIDMRLIGFIVFSCLVWRNVWCVWFGILICKDVRL